MSLARVMIIAGILGGGAAYILQGQNTSASGSTTATASTAECRQDLKCWAERKIGSAGVYCKDQIARRAKYDVQWTDAWYEQKFQYYSWANKDKGTIRYVGDKVKFQNGFGAWSPMTYRCTYNPADDSVADISITEGRLD